MHPQLLLDKMRRDWDERARENPRHYIADGRTDWSEGDFYQSGEDTLRQLILNDMINICQGRDPGKMRVLEIGCGAGRVTRALAGLFGKVDAVDISPEMVKLAREALRDVPNARVVQNNGMDLAVLGGVEFDFAFSMCVFHHIPDKSVIESYIHDVGRLLRPGALFKFRVQGYLGLETNRTDTWLGTPLSEPEMLAIADRCGFEARYRVGAGEERFWLWFFKK